MVKESDTPPKSAAEREAARKREKAERLASALRENLRRRKDQARARSGGDDEGEK